MSSGTTGLGEGNVLCSDKPAGPELELARAGLELYRELEQRLGDEARIRRKGALIVHTDESTWAAEPGRLGAMGLPGTRLLGAGEVRELEPELTGEIHGASLFPDDLQCDPRAIARALAREAARAGGDDPRGRPGHGDRARRARGRARRAASPVRGRRLAGARGRDRGGSVERAAGGRGRSAAAARAAQGAARPVAGAGAGPISHKVVDASYLASVSARARPRALDRRRDHVEGDILIGSSRERLRLRTAVDPAVGEAMASAPPGCSRAWAG